MSDRPSNVPAEQGPILDDAGEPQHRLHPVRRLLQFSLRGLLIVVTILCVWLGIAFHRARQQAEIVGFLEARPSGFVFYDFEEVDDPRKLDALPTSPYPTWLVEACGIDFFHNVTTVSSYRITNHDLKMLCKLSKLRGMYLHISSVSSEGLAPLGQLRELRTLAIESSEIDNRGLAELATLRPLRKLSLVEANIDNHGLEHLKKATQLTVLFLRDTRVTPAGASDLSRSLPNCTIDLYDEDVNLLFSAGPEASARD